MRIAPGTPVDVFLRWDADDIQPVGRLAYRDRVAYLEYDEDFVRSGLEISPVRHKTEAGLLRPYRTEVFEGLHGVFNDSLPDGWGRLLVDRRVRQLGVEPKTLTPLDRLACVGNNGIGALSYSPVCKVWEEYEDSIDLTQLAAYSRRVLEGKVDEVLSSLGRVGGSPAGARPKALVALDDNGHAVHGTDEVPPSYEHYLVKFRGYGDPPDAAAAERAYSAMAECSGVAVPGTRLLEGRDGTLFFASRRFDREGSRRFHVHSASGLLYSDIRIPALDYKDLVLLTRIVTGDHYECGAMFKLAVFNVLAHNRDDHARQFSFIMDRDGSWKLAPAYDLTWSPGPGGQHSTSVLGHGKDIALEHLIELGKIADLGHNDVKQIIERVEYGVSEWPKLASQYGVGNDSADRITRSLNSVRL